MTGAVLGSTPRGSLVLGCVNQAVSGFNPAWAVNANTVVTTRRIDQ
jgi:hypothetical protein